MSLRERLEPVVAEPAGGAPITVLTPHRSSRGYLALKQQVHQTLLDRVDLSRIQRLDPAQITTELRNVIGQILQEEDIALSEVERRLLVQDIRHEMLGFGPLEELLADPTISDILVNTASKVYVERHGRLELTSVSFNDNDHLLKIIDKIVSQVGRRIDESSPMVDARLPDGSRVNAVIPPLSIDGPILSIRRFAVKPLQVVDLLRFKSLTEPMAVFLGSCSRAKINMVISGGTGSGKTTLLNILSANIPAGERVVTIEDAAELQLQQPHVVRLETRPPNIEGRGEVNQRALVRNALRMRPDRIILGEVRGAEAFDMLQAMNTGHEGSMATIHANTPREAVARLENMIQMAGMNLTLRAFRQQIAGAVSLIIQVARLMDGTRRVVSIQELVGMEGETITMQELFTFRQTGLDANGNVQGHFAATGVRPRLAERLKTFGIELPDAFFDPSRHLS